MTLSISWRAAVACFKPAVYVLDRNQWSTNSHGAFLYYWWLNNLGIGTPKGLQLPRLAGDCSPAVLNVYSHYVGWGYNKQKTLSQYTYFVKHLPCLWPVSRKENAPGHFWLVTSVCPCWTFVFSFSIEAALMFNGQRSYTPARGFHSPVAKRVASHGWN